MLDIIIPMYNAEKNIYECITSITLQNYDNVNIIIVDDGSTDNSYNICLDLQQKFRRIEIYKKNNGGAASARNFGLTKSTSEYVMFVDSDDYLLPETLNQIIPLLRNNKDIFMFNLCKIKGNFISRIDDISVSINLETREVLSRIANLNKFPGSACAKAYKRDFLITNNIYFIEGIVNEDIGFNIEVFNDANSFEYYPLDLYIYRQGVKDSVTNKITPKNCLDMFYLMDIWLKKPNLNLEKIFSYEYSTLFYYYSRLTKKDKKLLRNKFKQYKYLLTKKKTINNYIILFLYTFIGLDATAKLIFIIYNKINKRS